MIDSITWEITDKIDSAIDELIDKGLTSFNENAAPLDRVEPLRSYAKLSSGEVVGGAVARTWGRCCSLDMVWVDEAYRRRGVAKQLIRLIETEARSRGCTLIFLETFSFQAPELYQRLGYEIACQFEGFPEGIMKFIFRKDLSLDKMT